MTFTAIYPISGFIFEFYCIKFVSRFIKIIKISGITFIVILLLLIFMWLKPLPKVKHDAPRVVPWELPDYRQAKTNIEILNDGRIQIEIEHLPLHDITPEMVRWFYKHLPISTVEISGNEYPLYHIFHPSEHGKIQVIENASDGTVGMGIGALIERHEWFASYDSQGTGRITEFSARGMTIQPEVAGMHFGIIRHEFNQTGSGTQYNVLSIIGSDHPIMGPMINLYIRQKMFPPKMLEQWLRHQVQEVSSLQFILPKLYHNRAKAVNNLYIIEN